MSSGDDPQAAAESADLNFLDPGAAAHPQPVFSRLRERCPIGRPVPGGGVCISRYEDVMTALRRPEIFSSVMPAGMIGNERPLIPLHIDPPKQVKYRKQLDPLFSRKRMGLLEKDMRELAGGLIEEFAAEGECEFNSAFAIPYPCTVFLRLMGLPQEDLALFLELKDGNLTVPELEQMTGSLRDRFGVPALIVSGFTLEIRRYG